MKRSSNQSWPDSEPKRARVQGDFADFYAIITEALGRVYKTVPPHVTEFIRDVWDDSEKSATLKNPSAVVRQVRKEFLSHYE